MDIDPGSLLIYSASDGCHQHSVSPDALTFDAAVLARGLGYSRPSADTSESEAGNHRPMPAHMVETVDAMLAKARELIEARWMWLVVPVMIDAEHHQLVCASPFSTSLAIGKFVGAQLKGSKAIAAFVVTIGARLEKEARAMMHGADPLGGYVLDTIGSMAAEAAADLLEAEISALARESSYKITNRFSPGYCSWETSGQHSLFSIFPSDRPAGVVLSQSSLMSPIKSISGLIGLGEKVKHRPYPCDLCSMKECHQRLTKSRL